MIPEEQRPAAALLGRLTGAAAPIETHISAVFVGPDAAFKLKKAVDLGFLDFTALEARERFARRELEINARFAPGLYRDVVPNRGAILIPTRDGEQGRFGFKCGQGATYALTQLLYSDAIVGFLRAHEL